MANKKIAFVIWAKNEAKLSFFLAKSLNAKTITVFNEKMARFKSLIIFRYFSQAKNTWRELKKEKPDVILVQNPPIVAVLVVYFYCIFYKAQFTIDTHTAAVLDFKWKLFRFLHKFLAKRALVNTFHNYKNFEEFGKWHLKNARVFNFYTPGKEEIFDEKTKLTQEIENKLKEATKKIKVFMVNRFANDDAFLEVMETAKIAPEMFFFITGNYKKVKLSKVPKNVFLTGFLDYPAFTKLMDKCDVVLSLTKRKDTLLWSAHEAVSLQKPVVFSDTEVLRHYFESFGLFSDHSPKNLKEKISEAQIQKNQLVEQEKEFEKVSNRKWMENVFWLKRIIEK